MNNFSKRTYFINFFLILFFSFIFIFSYLIIKNSFIDKKDEEKFLNLINIPKLNFGVDIKGGHLITAELEFNEMYKEKLEIEKINLQKYLWHNEIEVNKLEEFENFFLIKFNNLEDLKKIKIQDLSADLNFKCNNNKLECTFTVNRDTETESKIAQKTIITLSKRIDSFGLNEISITRYDQNKINILLPNNLNIDKVKEIITKTAKLSFHLVPSDDETSNKKDIQYLKLKNNNQTSIPVFKQSLLNGNLIKDARPSYSENGTGVFFELNNQGADIFSEITTKYKGKALAIVVDGQILSTPVISQIIKNGNCIINGKFSNEEAFNLSVFLKNGSVDANLKIIEEKRLEYKLDKDFKDSILIAIAVAFSLISLTMFLKYKFLGLISIFCLFLNLCIIVVVSTILNISISISSLISLILTIGISIDANIVTFEQIKENNEKLDTILIKKKFEDAKNAILDSNLTTIFAAIALVINGLVFIKGFGITLIIGTLTSFFTNMYLTKKIILTIFNSKYKKLVYEYV